MEDSQRVRDSHWVAIGKTATSGRSATASGKRILGQLHLLGAGAAWAGTGWEALTACLL
uniref:Uncharacterized protein n=1 Tax=Peronospora matthiolae TaxID=2874970 RepID=A0AAV1UPY6_9STRA